MKIYYAASVCGGRGDSAFYTRMVSILRELGHEIPTEHLGDESMLAAEAGRVTDEEICERTLSTNFRGCSLMIAEVTTPSLGVGYEVAYALGLPIPVVCFYRPSGVKRLSPMIKATSESRN